MSQADPAWGAPRIVGELQKRDINVAKSMVEKYGVRPRKPPSPRWKTFLNTHVKELVVDFLVVPTEAYKVLFVLLILSPSPAPRRACQRQHAPHCRVDWPASGPGVPMG
jgi:hypothetical protein